MELLITRCRNLASRKKTDMLLSLALSALGLQPGRLPLTRTVPLARVVSPQLQLARLDVEGTNVEVICSAFFTNACSPQPTPLQDVHIATSVANGPADNP